MQLVETGDPSTIPQSTPSLRRLNEHIPVAVKGTLRARTKRANGQNSRTIPDAELMIESISPLNTFDKDIIMTKDTSFPPEQRHLQIRNDAALRQALRFRSKVSALVRDELCNVQGFTDIDTPILFRSTPEGAREFLVPTRSPGLAYALPQSPQQYKQILMAGTITRYMQIARCFRDEDMRADRQPEFTQIDLEMAFATSEDVITTVESLIHRLWSTLVPVVSVSIPFRRISYQEAMSTYGSDKPDVRLGCEIQRVEHFLPQDLISKISGLQDPVVEAFKISVSENPGDTASFVREFMESPDAQPFITNPAGQPGIFIIDSTKPLRGLQPLGFEAADQLDSLLDLTDGDCIVMQARRAESLTGGYTMLGNARLAMNKAAVNRGLTPAPSGFCFLWVVDFPLFTPSSDSEPGQGGNAGLSSTHHPFTSPKTAEDVDLLLASPTEAIADHYDLVVNGVELGGGSRRIHDAAMQDFVMREVLKMDDVRISEFAHLLSALRAGCPPHAGIALGLDRLIAVMLGRDSVRDVMAFPKIGRGEDPLVKSPSAMTADQLETYHLRLKDSSS